MHWQSPHHALTMRRSGTVEYDRNRRDICDKHMIKVPQMKTRAKKKKEVIYWLLNFSKSKWVSQTLK